MAAQGTLTLNTKAYLPRGKAGDVAQWQLSNDTTFGGAPSIVKMSVRGPSKDGTNRVQISLDLPKAADETSVCACKGTIVGKGIFRGDVVIPSNFSSAERTDFYLRITGLIADAVFGNAVKDFEGAW